ncbi:MAG: UDP-glucose 4-epimerase GalE [Spirochaetes bacterium]|nr:UDP-glucose 4-epimerase GalE [Spirochaetota bacterium]
MVLIVGGAGYIGSHTVKELHKKGHEILVLDNLVHGHKEFLKWGKFVNADLENIKQLRSIFKKYPITSVMHFASYINVGESVTDPKKYYINNVTNTLNLLNVMIEYSVRHFIFSSTCATYGTPVSIPIDENHPQNPINPYGQSKLMIEKIIEDYSNAYDFSYVSLRYFNASGADQDGEIGEWHNPETHLIPIVLDAAINKRDSIEIYGTDYDTPDGTCIRDYIHVTDLADAHIKALEFLESGEKSTAFNIGTENGYTVREIIEKTIEITKREIKVVETGRREGDATTLISKSTKIKDTLKWEPQHSSLNEIIQSAWNWHKKLNKIE